MLYRDHKQGKPALRTATLWATAVAFLASAITFSVRYRSMYRYLLAHQPPHDGSPMPAGATGFPPEAAWLYAALIALGVFVVILTVGTVILYICLRRGGLNSRAR